MGCRAEAPPSRQPSGQPGGEPTAAGKQPMMGLPPLDPRSKSKNMAMKLMNKIGNKQPKKLNSGEAPKYPGAPCPPAPR